MRQEIGGYFQLEKLINKEYYSNLIALNSARNALLYVLKARKIKKIYLPYFLCNSVEEMCKRENFEYEFYHIGQDFLPIFDKKLGDDEFLYIVNYYGQVNEEIIKQLHVQYGNIIIDNVQAFFQKPTQGVDTIYSCRKFFGVPDGSYLFTLAKIEDTFETDVSKDRMKHLLGRYEGTATEYYEDFKANDHSFKDLGLCYMSALTHNILGAIDYKQVKQKREENYAVLARSLGAKNLLLLHMPVAPYCYPFYCKNGMEIKKRLAQKKIFVPTLWPNVLELEGTLEKDYAENILPLPCDQRYGKEEMKYILKEIEDV